MNKHASHDLAQMQSLPLEAKILMTKRRIRDWYEHWNGQVYIGFSGGKDSTVLKHIIDSMYDDVPALFVNTGLEYPEIQKFAMSQKNVVTVRPEMRFDEVIKKYGYPVVSKLVSKRVKDARSCISKGNYNAKCIQMLQGTFTNSDGGKSRYNCNRWGFLMDAPFLISHQCCDVMKKRPAHTYAKETGRKAIIGTMASESMTRRDQWFKYGCNAFESKDPTSAPLSFWTEQDILGYIVKKNVPYCSSIYGDIVGEHRITGAIFDIDELQVLYKQNEERILSNIILKTTGADRTGCTFCVFGCHMEKGENRFQRMKKTHPRQYEYCINGGEYTIEGFCQNDSGDWVQFVFEDDGRPLTPEEIENFMEEVKDNPHFKFERKWQPNKKGLGLGKVLDYIGVDYK